MPYTILFKPAANKAFNQLENATRKKIGARIDALAADPFPPGVRKIRGEETAYRIRVGDYRVIYDVLHKKLVVLILRIGYRREVYR